MLKEDLLINSKEFKQIIESKGWTLYDLSVVPGDSISWEELGQNYPPAEKFVIDHQYLFAPIPKHGQTLREAYDATKGLGPALRINDPDDSRWLSLQLCWIPTLAVFTHLLLLPESTYVTSPEAEGQSAVDCVEIPHEQVVEIFREHFKVVTHEEYYKLLERQLYLQEIMVPRVRRGSNTFPH